MTDELIAFSPLTDDEEVADGSAEADVTYSLSEEVMYGNPRVRSLIIIKRLPIVEADKAIRNQLLVMDMNDSSPYETLHSYVGSAIAPYFKSYIKETGRAER